MGHQVSTQGDVYAYGILFLEMFTGKRPTDDMFMDGLDLQNYVQRSLPEHVCVVIDPLLLSNGQVTAEVEDKGMECIASVLKTGVNCFAALPNDRMAMG